MKFRKTDESPKTVKFWKSDEPPVCFTPSRPMTFRVQTVKFWKRDEPPDYFTPSQPMPFRKTDFCMTFLKSDEPPDYFRARSFFLIDFSMDKKIHRSHGFSDP